MKPGNIVTIQLVAATSIAAHLIESFGSGPGLSHGDAVLYGVPGVKDGSLMGARSDSIGGQPPGIQIRPPFYEAWRRRWVFTKPVPPKVYTAWIGGLLKRRGQPYDMQDILGMIFGQHWHTHGHWICTQFLSQVASDSGALPPLIAPASEVTPNSLAWMLNAAEFDCAKHEGKDA